MRHSAIAAWASGALFAAAIALAVALALSTQLAAQTGSTEASIEKAERCARQALEDATGLDRFELRNLARFFTRQTDRDDPGIFDRHDRAGFFDDGVCLAAMREFFARDPERWMRMSSRMNACGSEASCMRLLEPRAGR